MTILTDLIFMAVNAWFDEHAVDGDDGLLSFADENEAYAFVQEINFRFHDLRQFDNFKGGYCIVDDTRTSLVVVLFLLEEEEIATCVKNFEITY